ncbi:MAG: PIN domain-containing protein [Nanoarchaeota archaeon]|nr:PIN domain-containing protein [Nanoarchaeota archaeon]
MNYFLDTYALIEIVKGNINYKKYLESEFYTSIFNLYEFYFYLLRDFNEEIAGKFFKQFKDRVINIEDEHIFKASQFKRDNKKKNFSYADCLGYAMALIYELRFLTGDKEFEKFENVEFVK